MRMQGVGFGPLTASWLTGLPRGRARKLSPGNSLCRFIQRELGGQLKGIFASAPCLIALSIILGTAVPSATLKSGFQHGVEPMTCTVIAILAAIGGLAVGAVFATIGVVTVMQVIGSDQARPNAGLPDLTDAGT